MNRPDATKVAQPCATESGDDPWPSLGHWTINNAPVKKLLFIFLCIGLVVGVGGVVAVVSLSKNDHLRADAPSGEMMALGLPFKGSSPHPLDGKLRVFLMDHSQTFMDKHQTSLPVTLQMRLEWVTDATVPTFCIRDQEGTRMVWRVEGQTAVCVQGQEVLAPDPYAEQDPKQ